MEMGKPMLIAMMGGKPIANPKAKMMAKRRESMKMQTSNVSLLFFRICSSTIRGILSAQKETFGTSLDSSGISSIGFSFFPMRRANVLPGNVSMALLKASTLSL